MLTIAVGIKNRAEQLGLTLSSVLHHSSEALKASEVELLVIDEESTDGLEDLLLQVRDYFNTIRLVQIDVKRAGVDIVSGSATITTNLAFLLAGGNRVLKFQPETLFLKDNIAFMLRNEDLGKRVPFANTFSGQAKLSPEMVVDVQYNAPLLDHRAYHVNQPGVSYHLAQDAEVGTALVASDLGSPFYPYVWGCAKDLFLESGLIDIDFMSGWAAEDDFMMLRLAQAGGELQVVDDMQAYHLWHKSSGRFRGGPFHKRNINVLNGLRDIEPDEFQRRAQRNKDLSLKCILG